MAFFRALRKTTSDRGWRRPRIVRLPWRDVGLFRILTIHDLAGRPALLSTRSRAPAGAGDGLGPLGPTQRRALFRQ